MLPRFSPLVRNFSTSLVKRSGDGGYPGANLPFGLHNKYTLTAWYILFFGSGMAAPMLIIRHSLLK